MADWMRRWAFAPAKGDGWIVWWWLSWVLAALFLLGSTFAAQLADGFLGVTARLDAESPGWILYYLVVAFALAAAVTLIYAFVVEERSFASLGMAGPAPLKRFVGGAGVGALYLLAVIAVIVALGGARMGEVAPAWRDPVELMWIAALLGGFIIQASAEEIIFRGWLMSAVAARGGLALAIIFNSVVFGVLHAPNVMPINWIAVANVGLVGVFLSLMAVKDGSIWGACGWHAAWNWVLSTGFEIEVSGADVPVDAFAVDVDAIGPATISGGAFGPEGSLVTTAALAVGSAWLLFLIARRQTQRDE